MTSDCVSYTARAEITYPFPNFTDAAAEIWEWKEISSNTL